MQYKMPCPKCGSANTHIMDKTRVWDPPKSGIEYSCYMCGFRLYGQKALDRVTEYQQAMENREALLRSMQEQEAKRMAEARIREARLKEELALMRKEEARIAQEKEALAAKLAQEERDRAAKEAEELRLKQEQELREKEEARVAKQREEARERAARWESIKAMREKDALRVEALRKEAKRERDARYRANKRARLAAEKMVCGEEVLSPPIVLTFPVISEPEVLPQVPEETGTPAKCAWVECENLQRENSKYCSRDCSVKNSRSRDRARKALKAHLSTALKA